MYQRVGARYTNVSIGVAKFVHALVASVALTLGAGYEAEPK